jgi:PKD repeat protein
MELHYFESVQEWNDDVLFADVLAEIDADYPFPMCVMLTSSGHLILAKGYIVGQHTLIFSDPYGDKNTPSWPSYDGFKAYYDWPGYNNGYENLDFDGSYGVIAWTITAHGEEVTYNDTIIDDVYYNHGFEMNNSENGSQMRYFRDQNAGYNGHSWWTLTEASADDICWVHWIPELTEAGYYNISAYIPATNANAQNAPYRIKHGDVTTTVLIDQADFNDQWADLGNFYFQPGDDFWVYLGDSTGIASESIAYDAVKFDYLPKPVASFELSSQDFCVGEEIAFVNTSSDAIAFAWNFPGASTSVSIEQNPSISYAAAGIYDVELIAFGIEENDTLELADYFEIHDAAIAEFTVNSNELYLPNAIAIFDNNSQNADSYFWDFDNGNTSTDSNPYCVYSTQGSYSVSLSASNDWCPESLFVLADNIIVSTSTQSGILSFDNINVYPNPANDFLEIQFVNEISKISITNNLGQIVFLSNDSEIKRIDISGLANGIYLMELVSGNEKYLTKIVVER